MEGDKDQESIKSKTTPDQGHHMQPFLNQRKGGGDDRRNYFHDQSQQNYGTGPRSNSQQLDLKVSTRLLLSASGQLAALDEWNFPFLSTGPVHFRFKVCWVLFFLHIFKF